MARSLFGTGDTKQVGRSRNKWIAYIQESKAKRREEEEEEEEEEEDEEEEEGADVSAGGTYIFMLYYVTCGSRLCPVRGRPLGAGANTVDLYA
jgi:hypothetical protein